MRLHDCLAELCLGRSVFGRSKAGETILVDAYVCHVSEMKIANTDPVRSLQVIFLFPNVKEKTGAKSVGVWVCITTIF